MSLKNAGKNVFEKEDGALEAFRRYLELDEKGVHIQFEQPNKDKGSGTSYINAKIPVISMKQIR